ncbi:MAG: hypothetical protein R3Y29_05205 [bacterium]
MDKGQSKVINIDFDNMKLCTLILYFSVDVCEVKIQNFTTHQHSLYKTFRRKVIVVGNLLEDIYLVTLYKQNIKNKKINYIKYRIRVPKCEYMEVFFE